MSKKLKKGISFFAVLFFVVLISPSIASSATYYVSTTGDNSNPGTEAEPWLTIQYAADTAEAGDTVNVVAGVYNETVSFTRSGTAGAPIVFQTDPDNRAIIDGTDLVIAQYHSLVTINEVSYLTFSGFEVKNSPYENILITSDSTHLKLLYLDVHDGGTGAYGVDAQFMVNDCGVPAFSEIAYNKIHDGPGGGLGLWTASGGYWNIHDNEVYNNEGAGNWDGVEIGGASAGTNHIIVKDNDIHNNGYNLSTLKWNNGADDLDVSSHGFSHHMLFEGNKITAGTTGPAFKIHSGSDAYTPGLSGHMIARNNILIRSNTNNYAFPDPVAYYNNTFFDSKGNQYYPENCSAPCNVGDSTYSGGDTGRANWKNNLFFTNANLFGQLILMNGTFNLTYASLRFQHNLYNFGNNLTIQWEKWRAAMKTPSVFLDYQSALAPDYPDVGSIMTTTTVEHMFTDYASEDFSLVSEAPAIDAGMPLTSAVNSGEDSTTLVVDRSSYFTDGYPVDGEYLGTPDSIRIGNNDPVEILSINNQTNTITLASAVSWEVGEDVTLDYYGTAPDIGAFEFVSLDTTPPTAGTVEISDVTSSGLTITATGASDETALAAVPYRYRNVTSNVYSGAKSGSWVLTGLNSESEYVFEVGVRDYAGNWATTTQVSTTTLQAPASPEPEPEESDSDDSSQSGGGGGGYLKGYSPFISEQQIVGLYNQVLKLQKILATLSSDFRIPKVSPSDSVETLADNLTYSFTLNQKFGDRGEAIRELQIKLNKLGYLVSSSGPGSLGLETDYFGSATQRALIKYQLENGIILNDQDPGAGLLGPKTRASLNKK